MTEGVRTPRPAPNHNPKLNKPEHPERAFPVHNSKSAIRAQRIKFSLNNLNTPKPISRNHTIAPPPRYVAHSPRIL